MTKDLVLAVGVCVIVALTGAPGFAKTKPCQPIPSVSDLTQLSPTIFEPNRSEAEGFVLHQELVEEAPLSDSKDEGDITLETREDLAALSIRTEKSVSPYVGAGMDTAVRAEDAPGVSTFEAEQEADTQNYHLGAGLNCALGKDRYFDLGYRYSNDNFFILSETGTPADKEAADDHHFSIGLKFGF